MVEQEIDTSALRAEYLRGYRRGIEVHSSGVSDETAEEHRRFIDISDDGSGDPYLDTVRTRVSSRFRGNITGKSLLHFIFKLQITPNRRYQLAFCSYLPGEGPRDRTGESGREQGGEQPLFSPGARGSPAPEPSYLLFISTRRRRYGERVHQR